MTAAEIAALLVGERVRVAAEPWVVAFSPQHNVEASGLVSSVLVRQGDRLMRIDPLTPDVVGDAAAGAEAGA